MTKEQKNEIIEALKEKFTQYDNFYVTNTESLSVAQVTKLRRVCFDKNVEMKVAKNTLIKKALESLGNESYNGLMDSFNNVTALMFSENPKDPALIISSFRTESKGEKPELKAAFINGDVYTGDENLKTLTKIKTKNELIGEVIGLLQSPAKRVLAALLHHHEKQAAGITSEAPSNAAPATEESADAAPATEGSTDAGTTPEATTDAGTTTEGSAETPETPAAE
jgi:large subunit ribosomal protein L10